MGRHKPTRPASGPWLPLAILVCVAMGLRLAHLYSILGTPVLRVLQTNASRYDAWAASIAAGHSPLPPFDQPPGYAWLLGQVYSVVGHHPEAVLLLQAVLDSLTCLAIAVQAGRLASPRAGWIAGMLAAVYGPLIYFCGELLPATVPLHLFTISLTAAVFHRWLVAGLLLAACATFRAETLLAAPLLGILAARQGGLRAGLAAVVPTVVLVAGLTIWTAALTGRWVPGHVGAGLNLWLGNNPHADGVSPFASGPLAPKAEVVRVAAGTDVVRADRMFARWALDYVRAFPRQALELAGRKLRWTLTARELPNTTDVDWQLSHSPLFSLPGLPPGFGLLAVLAAFGGAYGTGLRAGRGLLALPAGVALGTCVLFFTNGRFRLPLVLPLFVCAGGGMDRLWTDLRARRNGRRRLPRAALAACGAAWVVWSNPWGVWTYSIPELTANAGIVEREAGNFASAAALLRHALVSQPEDAISWVHLALALEQDQRPGEAAEAYLEGLERGRDSDGVLLERTRRFFQRQGLPISKLEAYIGTTSPELRAGLRHEIVQRLR